MHAAALAILGVAVAVTAGSPPAQEPRPADGVSLSDLSWVEAEPFLTASAVVVIPRARPSWNKGLI